MSASFWSESRRVRSTIQGFPFPAESPLESISRISRSLLSPSVLQHITTMCNVTRFRFICRHSATKRFRSSKCDQYPACVSRGVCLDLPMPCYSCEWHQVPIPRRFKADIETARLNFESLADKQEWYIPRQLFVDVGFRSLDPFTDDRRKLEAQSKRWSQESDCEKPVESCGDWSDGSS